MTGVFAHSDRSALEPTQGENLYFFMHSDPVVQAELWETDRGAEEWYSEIDLYDFSNPMFDSASGHFTQMVWRDTCTMGCGFAEPYLVCRYSPQGNVFGDFADNVLPLI